MLCPLCRSKNTGLFHADKTRQYYACDHCCLVFLDPSQRLCSADEKAEYLRHENHPSDGGYRQFLRRLSDPLCLRIPPGSVGLDFGCGPGPTLSVMLEEHGHQVALYDPFFFPNDSVLKGTYDFISGSEVVEHLFSPGETLSTLYGLLRPGGWLGLMTKRVRNATAFATWHYKNDPTHVCFFHLKTFEFLAAQWRAELVVTGSDVVLIQRPNR